MEKLHIIWQRNDSGSESESSTSLLSSEEENAAGAEERLWRKLVERQLDSDDISLRQSSESSFAIDSEPEEVQPDVDECLDRFKHEVACIKESPFGSGTVARGVIEAMEELKENGRERAITDVYARLEHADSDVREAAVLSLICLVAKGDERAVTGLCARLEDANDYVRRAAVEALGQVARKGDERAITCACASLADADEGVRYAAVEALGELAEKGNEQAITGVCARLEDAAGDVRGAAIEALVLLAEIGDERAISCVCARLEVDGEVQVEAMEALVKLTEKGDERAITQIFARLEHADADVIEAAIEALGQVADKGDERAICGIVSCLENEKLAIRQLAMESLGSFMLEGDKVRIEEAISCLNHNSAAVLHVKDGALGTNLRPFILALRKNRSVTALDLTQIPLSCSDMSHIVKALEENMSLTTLNLPYFSVDQQVNEQVSAALAKNKAGVQVVTLEFFQEDPNYVNVVCTSLSGDKFAILRMAPMDDLTSLLRELTMQALHPRRFAFLSITGSLLGGPAEFPQFAILELHLVSLLEQAQRDNDGSRYKDAVQDLAVATVSRITKNSMSL